jgi:integrase
MAKTNLTRARVDALAYNSDGPQKQILWDQKCRGFGCRVTPEGGKQYVLLYRCNGRQRLMSLGPVQDFPTVEAARTKASGFLHELRKSGTDPMAERERMADAETLTALWEVYEREHVANLAENTRRAMRSVWKAHVSDVLGDLSPGQITKADVVRMHDRATKKGAKVAANRAVQRLRAALNWLHERNPRQFPQDWKNPCDVKLHKELARKEILDLNQQRALLVSLAQEPDPWARTYIHLVLLTACRAQELLKLTWENVDFERGEALILKRKNGEDLRVPLSSVALELLKALPVTAGSPYVFPSPRKPNQPYTSNAIRRRYNDALDRAGLPHRTFHDLRRSCGTNYARQGASTKIIAQLLGNTDEVTSRVYVQLAATDLRHLAETNANNLSIPNTLPAKQS